MKRHYCTPFVMTQIKPKNGKYQTRMVSCKGWRCKYCGPFKKYQLLKKITEHQKTYSLFNFFTLTLVKDVVPPKESPIYIQNCWKKFSILFRRKYGAFKYIIVKEFQKNGMAHIHGLVDKKCSPFWLSDTWKSVGGGMRTDLQTCDEKTVKYLIKYVTKETPMKLPKRYRRVASSRGLALFPRNPSGEWRVLNEHYDWLRSEMRSKSDEFELITTWENEVGFTSNIPLSDCNLDKNKIRDPQFSRGAI